MEIVRSSKKVHINSTHEETRDFFGELPDSILVHILSFLPTEDAIKTVLLRSFGNLWRSVPVLDLNGCNHHECWVRGVYEPGNCYKFDNIIHHVSNLHDVGVLDKLSLKYQFLFSSFAFSCFSRVPYRGYAERDKAIAGHIDQLVGYAMNRKVKVLNLDLRACGVTQPTKLYVLLPDVLRSNYLTHIMLIACNMKSCREISLKVLRVLYLQEVVLSDEIMENILLNCPVLEELSLSGCYELGNLYCENKNLKKLRLCTNSRLHVSCPHLTSLEIFGWIGLATLLDVSSVMDASISYTLCLSDKPRVNDCTQRLLQKISLSETLTLSGHTILLLTVWNISGVVPCAAYQWKNLIIKLDLTRWHYPGLSWLLKSCPSLETLTVYIDTRVPFMVKDFSKYWFRSDRDWESYLDIQETGFPRLECIIIHVGCIDESCVDQMLKFLLRSCTKLQKIMISIKDTSKASSTARQKDERCSSPPNLKFLQDLSTYPRASSQAMIYFSC